MEYYLGLFYNIRLGERLRVGRLLRHHAPPPTLRFVYAFLLRRFHTANTSHVVSLEQARIYAYLHINLPPLKATAMPSVQAAPLSCLIPLRLSSTAIFSSPSWPMQEMVLSMPSQQGASPPLK